MNVYSTSLRVIVTFTCVTVGCALVSCGQDSAFVGKSKTTNEPAPQQAADQQQAVPNPDAPIVTDKDAAAPAATQTVPQAETGGQPKDATPVADVTIPGVSKEDETALKQCLTKWRDAPVDVLIKNVATINAAITVGGYGAGINDTARTAEPKLILVKAAVNVLSTTTYNLMNPNGYYCIKTNVNVLTTLTVNLHCAAHLAEVKLDVNVGGAVSGQPAVRGVSVLSDVKIVDQKPAGDKCIR